MAFRQDSQNFRTPKPLPLTEKNTTKTDNICLLSELENVFPKPEFKTSYVELFYQTRMQRHKFIFSQVFCIFFQKWLHTVQIRTSRDLFCT